MHESTRDEEVGLGPAVVEDVAQPALLLLLECERPTAAKLRLDLGDVDVVEIGRRRGEEPVASREGAVLRIRLDDPWLSSRHAHIHRGSREAWTLADLGSRNGTRRNHQTVSSAPLDDGDLIEIGRSYLRFRAALPVSTSAMGDVIGVARDDVSALETLMPDVERELGKLRRLAGRGVSVLIHGPSGVGKELIARAVHQLSGRGGAFVPVNCGGLPATLLESELFGYRKGAFSGALKDQVGLIQSADGGTLFLDEIGDLPLDAQAAFLRVLEERRVRPVGGSTEIPVDFEIVAASHRDLAAMVRAKEFRADLYARLSGVTIRVPSLAQRSDDLGLLIGRILSCLGAPAGVSMTPAAARALFRHDWPLNVRELKNALKTALALCDGVIELDHLPPHIGEEGGPFSNVLATGSGVVTESATPGAFALAPDGPERRDQLLGLLTSHQNNLSAVARVTGRPRSLLRRWLRRYGIDRAQPDAITTR